MEHFKDKKTGETIKAVYHWDTWSASEIVTMLIGDECEAHLEDGVLFIYDQPVPYEVYIALDGTGVRCITKPSIETYYTKIDEAIKTPEEAQTRIDKQKILEAEQRERDLKELKRIVGRYNIKSIDDFVGDKR